MHARFACVLKHVAMRILSIVFCLFVSAQGLTQEMARIAVLSPNLWLDYSWNSDHDQPELDDHGQIIIFKSSSANLGCDAQLFLTDLPIQPGVYEASQEIVATETVVTGTVTLRAGTEVILDSDSNSEFEVPSGVTLEIEIGPCTF